MDKTEMLEKLQALNELIERYHQSYDEYERGCSDRALKKVANIKEEAVTMPGVPAVVNAMPDFPIGEEAYEKEKAFAQRFGMITFVALFVVIASFVLYFVTKVTFFAGLAVVLGFIWFGLNRTRKDGKEVLAKKKKVYEESAAHADQTYEKFRQALACYEKEVEAGVAAAKEFGQKYRKLCEAHMAVLREFADGQKKAKEDCAVLLQKIKEHDYILPEHLCHVPKLISLLRSGRADSYKEALNMAIDEERQDAIEAARQEEEARRVAAMERQAEEERRHNMMMERQQAAHERAMERAAREQADDARRAQEKAERDRKAAGYRKCINCANKSKCNIYVQDSGAGLTCGAYRPR